ncbi:MAG: hypothetical protein R2794_02910 [Chitinophagales bacterium]
MKRLFTIVFILTAISAHAQSVTGNHTKHPALMKGRLDTDQSLTISPNPLPKGDAILTVHSENIEVYGFRVLTTLGEIVELENLSGKPNGSIIDLHGAVDCGQYIIIFETDSGNITRRFMVL